jgi:predicted nucleotidyltransferase
MSQEAKITEARQLLTSSIVAPPGARIRSPKRTDALSATLASGALARVVIDFAVHPDDAPYGREIQRRTGLTPRSLQTELARLERLGVIRRRPEGRLVRYELIEGNPRWRALRALIRELADPVDVVRNALADVPGIAAAFIFGSFARGDTREDSDVDVFLLGENIPERVLYRRTIEAGILLDREVNLVEMTRDDVARRIESGSSFIRNVLSGPKIWLAGSQEHFEVTPESAS